MTNKKALEFSADGHRYFVRDIHAVGSAYADLWNDRLYLQIDHRGRVKQNGFLQPNMTSYCDPWRCFYIRDEADGTFWSAPYDPVQAEVEDFECAIGLGDICWHMKRDAIAVDLKVMVPPDDDVELWEVTVRNTGRRRRRVSLTSCFPIGLRGYLAQQSCYLEKLQSVLVDYLPYYVKYQDLPQIQGLKNNVFCASDAKPTGVEVLQSEFTGGRGWHDPLAMHQKRLRARKQGPATGNQAALAAMQYVRTLRASGSFTVRFALGPARDQTEAGRLSRRYLRPQGFERAERQIEKFQARYETHARVQTPDPEFNHFVNHWLPRRTLMLTRAIRHNMAPQGRNVIQDAMGGVYTDPASAREWFLKVWTHQHANGWLPHGMPFAPGVQQIPINQIPHKDINVWGPLALHFYLAETGDFELLDEPVAFADGSGKATLYEHICLGLDWLLKDRTRRKLCRIGQGDWNDPLNMAGINEKGESVWLSQALVWSLRTWVEIAALRKDRRRVNRYRREADVTAEAVNRFGWDGAWYLRGFTDEGRPFGTKKDREGKVFLNAQSWALMSGVADKARTRKCIAAVEKHLSTPSGPMTLAPAFTRFVPDIGKLTQKIPGTGENASVYCHAATFYGYALLTVGQSEKAFEVLRGLLPGYGGNTIARSEQIPLYIPNFFRGAPAGVQAGESSHSPNTGTAPWYHRTIIAMLMGVRAELDGLRLDPKLPGRWRRARVWRQWRGATYDIEIVRRRTVRQTEVELDGKRLDGNLLPVPGEGAQHQVRVVLPAG